MSGGSFTDTKYETDGGSIVPIRVQPETLTATIGGEANEAPTEAFSAGFPSARARGSKRAIGITARRVSVRFATPPTGYKAGSSLSIPILTKALYDSISKGDAVTYLGASGVVGSKIPESIK